MRRLVVIGGGIAGLAAAYSLQKIAIESGEKIDLTVLEREIRLGGKIITERSGGFVVEGGPDTFLATKPWGVELCRELGLESRLNGTNPDQKNTYVLHGGELQPLPDGLAMMIPTQVASMARTRLLSWPEKARMGLDFFLPPDDGTHDESLGAFVSRRLGRRAYENLIEPLMSGIYAGDGDQLSLQATFPYLRDMELKHGGLIRGALALRQMRSQNGNGRTNSRSVFLTPQTGLAEIVEGLTERLSAYGAQLRTSTAARSILPHPDGYRIVLEDGNNLHADGIILASPAFASAEMVEGFAPELASELRLIPYVTTATVSLAYPLESLPRALDGYGYVIPRREGRVALACTWTSTKFPHRAPHGYALLRVFIGRAGQEAEIDWDETNLVQIARQEVALSLGINSEPTFSRVFIWEQAMPQYVLGHPARIQRIDNALTRYPGLALAGNGYRGIGIPDCIHSGEIAAQKVLLTI